jgi:hypothetical protein
MQVVELMIFPFPFPFLYLCFYFYLYLYLFLRYQIERQVQDYLALRVIVLIGFEKRSRSPHHPHISSHLPEQLYPYPAILDLCRGLYY